MSCSFLRFFLLVFLLGQSALAQASDPIEFIYCYEATELLPHFTGNSFSVPKTHPGAAIEILQELDKKVVSIKIKYVRKPWLRCLNELAAGKVSAVIGSYSLERSQFAVFPRVGDKLDTRLAFSNASTCLLRRKSVNIGWDGQQFSFDEKTTIAVPRGYKIISNLKAYGFIVYEANSAEHAHDLLFTNRVSASIGLCNSTNYPDTVVKNPIPIRTHYGYLIFSKVFYQHYKKISNDIWQTLKLIDKKYFYLKYNDRLQ